MAITYDLLLLASVLFCATAVLLIFTGGRAIRSGNILYDAYLLSWSYLYFAWSWIHGGQTLGMKSWGIRLIGLSGERIGWRRSGVRFLLAMLSWLCAGAGFLWALRDPRGLTLHDRWSASVPVYIPHHRD